MAREINIVELADILHGTIVGDFDREHLLVGTCPIDRYVEGKISFIRKTKYVEMLAQLKGAVIIAPEDLTRFCEKYPNNIYIIVKDAAASMMMIQEFFYSDQSIISEEGICQTARVHPSAEISRMSYIGENVFIGKDVIVGEGTKILHNSCILDHVVIGSGTHIYPGVCIYNNCQIGNDCLIHSGARIGPDGFRFEQDIDCGLVRKWLHVGNVIIGDRVEIGANCTIDRATFEDDATILADDVKLDDQVHIGHNAKILSRSLIAAQTCISGSVKVGEDVWIGAGVTISSGVHVGDRAKVLLNAVVAYDVAEGEMVSGFYAMSHRQWKHAWGRMKEEV